MNKLELPGRLKFVVDADRRHRSGSSLAGVNNVFVPAIHRDVRRTVVDSGFSDNRFTWVVGRSVHLYC